MKIYEFFVFGNGIIKRKLYFFRFDGWYFGYFFGKVVEVYGNLGIRGGKRN